jgi:DegV family protein with EDD domain
MSNVCILTDSTAQFPIPAFAGRDLVHIIPLHVNLHGEPHHKGDKLRSADLPRTLKARGDVRVSAPGVDEFEQMFQALSTRFEETVVITHSEELSETYPHARTAAKNASGRNKIHLIDAGTVATGLGLVVQRASAAAAEGLAGEAIVDLIRGMLPRVYTVFCLQSLTYLTNTGYIGQVQAELAEYLKVLQMFNLDGGHLNPTQKARNKRHLVDLIFEFVSEFPQPEHVAFLQGVPPYDNETRALRERLNEEYGEVEISEHVINVPLAGMIGPRSLGMFILERE